MDSYTMIDASLLSASVLQQIRDEAEKHCQEARRRFALGAGYGGGPAMLIKLVDEANRQHDLSLRAHLILECRKNRR